jgi:hypothetical protein
VNRQKDIDQRQRLIDNIDEQLARIRSGDDNDIAMLLPPHLRMRHDPDLRDPALIAIAIKTLEDNKAYYVAQLEKALERATKRGKKR